MPLWHVYTCSHSSLTMKFVNRIFVFLFLHIYMYIVNRRAYFLLVEKENNIKQLVIDNRANEIDLFSTFLFLVLFFSVIRPNGFLALWSINYQKPFNTFREIISLNDMTNSAEETDERRIERGKIATKKKLHFLHWLRFWTFLLSYKEKEVTACRDDG